MDVLTVPRPFIGRSADLHRVLESLASSRLVTIVGPPGIGKTALAAALAKRLQQRGKPPGGIRFVGLRGSRTLEAARFSLVRAIGAESPRDRDLILGIRRLGHVLLILDNVEDTLGPDRDAFLALIGRVLRRAPKVRLVLTCRQPLGHIPGGNTERIVRVEPLSIAATSRLLGRLSAAPEEVLSSPAASSLFDALKGHPLAIRLAAPLLSGHSVDELDGLMRAQVADPDWLGNSRSDEQPVLSAYSAALTLAMDELRGSDARAARLLGVMSLLPGGAMAEDLDAIEGEGWRDPMDELRRSSLVERRTVADTERFTAPPAVLVRAMEEFPAEERIPATFRAARHYAAMSQVLFRGVVAGGKSGVAAWALFTLEELNLWASLDPRRAVSEPGAAAGALGNPIPAVIAIAAHLAQLLVTAGRPQDALRAAELGASIARTATEEPAAEPLFKLVGELRLAAGDVAGARRAQERLLEIYRESGDMRSEANVLRILGDLKLREEDRAGALRDYELALALHREVGNVAGEANCREGIGRLRLQEENYEAARQEFRAALAIHAQRNEMLGVSANLGFLGRTESIAGRHPAAVVLFEEALVRHRKLGDRTGEALDLQSQAESLWAMSYRAGALAAWWQAHELFRRLHPPSAKEIEEVFAELNAQIGEEGYQELVEDLEQNAEIRRQAAVGAARPQALMDPFLDGILRTVGG